MEAQDGTALVSPAEDIAPAPASGSKRTLGNGPERSVRERDGSEAIDPDALSKALEEFEDAQKAHEKTPNTSPSRKRQRLYGDRLVVSLHFGEDHREVLPLGLSIIRSPTPHCTSGCLVLQ